MTWRRRRWMDSEPEIDEWHPDPWAIGFLVVVAIVFLILKVMP